MYQIQVNNEPAQNIELIKIERNLIRGTINNKPITTEIEQTHRFEYYLKYNNKPFNVLILKINKDEKKLTIKINGKRTELIVKDKFDLLLQKLGMDQLMQKKTESIKAPMPGLVLNILVSEGQAVKKGDTILILEAMKMENALKAPHDGVVKKIAVSKGAAVEKNQLLIEL